MGKYILTAQSIRFICVQKIVATIFLRVLYLSVNKLQAALLQSVY